MAKGNNLQNSLPYGIRFLSLAVLKSILCFTKEFL